MFSSLSFVPFEAERRVPSGFTLSCLPQMADHRREAKATLLTGTREVITAGVASVSRSDEAGIVGRQLAVHLSNLDDAAGQAEAGVRSKSGGYQPWIIIRANNAEFGSGSARSSDSRAQDGTSPMVYSSSATLPGSHQNSIATVMCWGTSIQILCWYYPRAHARTDTQNRIQYKMAVYSTNVSRRRFSTRSPSK